MVSRCPNCALAPTEPVSGTTPSIGRAVRMLQTLNTRFKIVLLFAFAAVLVAGVLRHTIHVYGGIEPAEIRADFLLLVFAIAIVALVVRASRRR